MTEITKIELNLIGIGNRKSILSKLYQIHKKKTILIVFFVVYMSFCSFAYYIYKDIRKEEIYGFIKEVK